MERLNRVGTAGCSARRVGAQRLGAALAEALDPRALALTGTGLRFGAARRGEALAAGRDALAGT